MNTKNLWIAAASGAVVTTLVVNVPVVAFVNVLMCVGFWGSAVFAVWLYRRRNGTLTVGQGIALGALTGLLAGALGFSISFLGLAGLQGIVNEIKLFAGAENAGTLDFTLGEAIAFNISGVMFNILFGTIGGIIGGAVFRTDRLPSMQAAVERA
ncbi:MAG: hypothetical protein WBM17_12250 [Anaerolineales bacterium]